MLVSSSYIVTLALSSESGRSLMYIKKGSGVPSKTLGELHIEYFQFLICTHSPYSIAVSH